MAAAVEKSFFLDSVGGAEAGQQSEARCTYLVNGLTKTDLQVITEALGASGLPAIGSSPTGLDGIVLASMNVRAFEGDPSRAWVDCHYVARGSGQAIALGVPLGGVAGVSEGNPGANFNVEGAATLTSLNTNVDWNGNPLLVTYGADTQRVDATIDLAHQTVTISGPMASAFPHIIQAEWVNHINSAAWFGAGPYYWRCVDVTYSLANANTRPWWWNWQFTFEYAPESWLMQVSFTDENGRVPTDAVIGNGRAVYQMNPMRDFNSFFRI